MRLFLPLIRSRFSEAGAKKREEFMASDLYQLTSGLHKI